MQRKPSTIRLSCSGCYQKVCLTILILLIIQGSGPKINSLLSKNRFDRVSPIFTCSIKVGDALRHKRNAVRHERNASRHKRNAPRHKECEVTFHLEHHILIEFQPNKEKYQESQRPCELKCFCLFKVLTNKCFR